MYCQTPYSTTSYLKHSQNSGTAVVASLIILNYSQSNKMCRINLQSYHSDIAHTSTSLVCVFYFVIFFNNPQTNIKAKQANSYQSLKILNIK